MLVTAKKTKMPPWGTLRVALKSMERAPVTAEPALGLQGDVVRCEREWRVAVRSDTLSLHGDTLRAALAAGLAMGVF